MLSLQDELHCKIGLNFPYAIRILSLGAQTKS